MNRKELLDIRLKLIERDLPAHNPPILIAVSKRSPFSDIEALYDLGHRDFAENRVDELLEKATLAKDYHLEDIRFHFIGSLQSKKVAKLLTVPYLKSIHSVTNVKLLNVLLNKKHIDENNIDLFLQVNTSDEAEKGGFSDWDELAKATNHLLEHIDGFFNFKGLMTMSRIRTDNFDDDARKCFKQLSKIKNQLEADFDIQNLELSMGMTSDYLIATEEGSHYLRLGSKIFAPDPNS